MFQLTIELNLHGRPLKVGDSLFYWDSDEWVAAEVLEMDGRLTISSSGRRYALAPNQETCGRLAWDQKQAEELDMLRVLRNELVSRLEHHTLPLDYLYVLQYLETGDPEILPPSARAVLIDRMCGLELDRVAPEPAHLPSKRPKRHK